MATEYISPPAGLEPGSLVWAYLRDSGGESQEQSVSQQRAEIERYCRTFGLALSLILADVARSGGSAVGRDKFNDLMDMTADPDLRPAGLLLWNFARFARDLDDSNYYKSLLRKRGIIIHSLTDPVPPGHWGHVVETIIDIANEEKRHQTGRDVKRALASMTRQGFAPGGFPPRGYLAEKVTIGHKRDGRPRIVSRWTPDPKLWNVVQLAWQLRAAGKSYHDIAQATAGVLYQSKNCWPHFFANKTYLGVGKCGSLEVPDHHPAAIDQATWNAVQQLKQAAPRMRKAGNVNHPRRVAAPATLSGLSVCIHCGAAMVSSRANTTKGKPWPYYICGRKSRQGYKSCVGRTINGRKADAAILDAVLAKVLTPDYLTQILKEVQSQFADTLTLDRETERAQQDLAACELGLRHLTDQIENFGPSKTVADKLREREGERAGLVAALERLAAKRLAANIQVTPEALALMLDVWRGELAEAREAGEARALRAFLKRFVSKVELGYNMACIHYTFPLEALTLNWDQNTWGHSY